MSGRLQSCRGLSRFSLLFGFGFRVRYPLFLHDVAVWFGGVVAAEAVGNNSHDALTVVCGKVRLFVIVPAVAKAPVIPVSIQPPVVVATIAVLD